MDLATNILNDPNFQKELIKNQVRLVHLGRKDRLPSKLLRVLTNLENTTQQFSRFWLNLAIDYGGLDETARAVAKMIRESNAGQLTSEIIEKKPEVILEYLDTHGQPLPDLIIRTGVKNGEIPHTSGLMPLQSTYSCWEFSTNLFPDLSPEDLAASITKFTEYERRFGR